MCVRGHGCGVCEKVLSVSVRVCLRVSACVGTLRYSLIGKIAQIFASLNQQAAQFNGSQVKEVAN